MSTARPGTQADDVARAAAAAAGIRVREVDRVDDVHAVKAVFDAIWTRESDCSLFPVPVIRANAHAGGHVALAERADRPVGAALGFVGVDEAGRPHLHSHAAAAVSGEQGRGVGAALKWQQRAWCVARGIAEVRWTFDPLIRRNARFNLVKLGAMGAAYLEDFYGRMGDAVNGQDESDRILCAWPLLSRRVEAASAGDVQQDEDAARDADRLLADVDGQPRTARAPSAASARLLVATPPDAESLRRTDPTTARTWRHAMRDALGDALADGFVAVHMTRAGDYVLERRPSEGD